jgi:hypothetical protein
MLRTDALAQLLVGRLLALGAMSEAAAIEALDTRSPGRGPETIEWAIGRSLIRRVDIDGTTTLEAAGAPARKVA